MVKRMSKKQRQQRQQLIFVAVGVVAALIVAVAIILITSPSGGAELPDDINTKYQGLQQSTSAQGYPQLGDPDAPILVQEFSSFVCPYCKQLHEDVISPDLLPLIESGQVRLIFSPIDLGHDADEPAMIRAAMCGLEQGKFFEMHDTMFHWQGLVSFSQERVEDAADELGLDVDDFMSCYNSNRYDQISRTAVQDMQDRGLRISTPTVLVNRIQVDPFAEMLSTINTLIIETATTPETSEE